jgi:hypothetical protein
VGHKHYGWVSGGVSDGYPLTTTLFDWAYEGVPGRPIRTGELPPPPSPPSVAEPSALGLLALGVPVVWALARRRRAAQNGTRQDCEST